MKKSLAKSILLILILLIFTSCNKNDDSLAESATATPTLSPQEAYKNKRDDYVVFYRSTEPQSEYINESDILAYESKYSDCNGTWFKNQLQGEDLIIYNSYFYAMENGLTGFELYVEDNEKDFDYIRQAVCLDSPFLAQNFNILGEKTFIQPIDFVGESIMFSIEQFSETRWPKNMEALEKCRNIVATIPAEYDTELEKMEYLYRYVCDNVEYVPYDRMLDEDYLYDAVCEGKTVCDGYSNMLNLLFNLIGVECCEAMGSDIENKNNATLEELTNNPGHTWVVAKIGDTYYNFDPTFEDSRQDTSKDQLLFFGYSDNLVSVKYIDFDTYRPKCSDASRDFNYADIIVDNITDNNTINDIADSSDQSISNGKNTIIVAVKSSVDETDYNTFVDNYRYKINNIKSFTAHALDIGENSILIIEAIPW